MTSGPDRRLLVPEIVQASAMDCGPAALSALLGGFGLDASYGRLREACQTSVDGTSIDTLEEVARQLGLDVEQVMVPVDHVMLPEAGLLPGIVVVRVATGFTHFVVAWRRHGRLVQVMDPATGRRWPTAARFRDDVLVHRMPVDAAAWRAWAGTDDFTRPLHRRMADLGVAAATCDRWLASSLDDASWRSIGALDATTRLIDRLAASRALRGRAEIESAHERLAERARERADDETPPVPDACWSVRPAASGPDGAGRLDLRGAVVLTARRGRLASAGAAGEVPVLPRDVVASLREPPHRPLREIVRRFREDGVLSPAVLAACLGLGALSVVVQALLYRSLLDVGRDLATTGGRLVAMGALLLFAVSVLLVEAPVALGLRRMGRRLETRLRIELLSKLPRLPDRYFASRLNSDMAERGHALHQVRDLPVLAGHAVRLIAQLLCVTAGLLWLAPESLPLVIASAAVAVGLPLLAQPILLERDLRARTFSGALSRFHLDALLGIVPIRTHGGEAALHREHDVLLADWARAALDRLRVEVVVEALTFVAGYAAATVLLLHHASTGEDPASALLLAWWALALPALGEELGQVLLQVPARRNVTLRLLEPLSTPEEGAPTPDVEATARPGAASLDLQAVRVVAGGHVILDGVSLSIGAGEHVAIVGPSGAGKSSLLALLLGWHRAAGGRVLYDGEPLDGEALHRARREIAWVDPAVQIWNRSLLDNLRYGSDEAEAALRSVAGDAELSALLERLPQGFQSQLGEGGALVSGGEGQRVRLGRALARGRARLVLLDEPFRGLDREARRRLLERARRRWREATLLCVTHDVGETRDFDRVVVVDGGRVVEVAAPAVLERADGRYARLLAADAAVLHRTWRGAGWRRMRLEDGRLSEVAAP